MRIWHVYLALTLQVNMYVLYSYRPLIFKPGTQLLKSLGRAVVQALVVKGSVYEVKGLKKANWRCSCSYCRGGAAGFTDSGQQAFYVVV